MARDMIWSEGMVRWGCSDCMWVFMPSGPPVGNTLDEMTENFVAQRYQDFASHVFNKKPAPKKPNDSR
jgi:hypothetical protein